MCVYIYIYIYIYIYNREPPQGGTRGTTKPHGGTGAPVRAPFSLNNTRFFSFLASWAVLGPSWASCRCSLFLKKTEVFFVFCFFGILPRLGVCFVSFGPLLLALGPSWGLPVFLKKTEGFLGIWGSCPVLGPSWGYLGAVLGEKGASSGRQECQKG